MNKNIFKIGGSAIAVLLAGTLAVQLVTKNDLVANASVSTLPGIETIRNNILTSNDAFRVLEVVPDLSDAQFGYLIGGCEPFYACLKDDPKYNTVLDARYLSGSSTLTYGQCSLYDEKTSTWVSVEDKLNSFTNYYDKVSFSLFMKDQYNTKLSGNLDIEEMVELESDLVQGTLTFDPNNRGNYQMDLNLVSSSVPALSAGSYYMLNNSSVTTAITQDQLNDLRDSVQAGNYDKGTLYYKKIHYSMIDVYALVGDAKDVIADVDKGTTIKVVMGIDSGDQSPFDTSIYIRPIIDGLYPDSMKFVENSVHYSLQATTVNGINSYTYEWDDSAATVGVAKNATKMTSGVLADTTIPVTTELVSSTETGVTVNQLRLDGSLNSNYISGITVTVSAKVKDSANASAEEIAISGDFTFEHAEAIAALSVIMDTEEKFETLRERIDLAQTLVNALTADSTEEEKAAAYKALEDAEYTYNELLILAEGGGLDEAQLQELSNWKTILDSIRGRYEALADEEQLTAVEKVIRLIDQLPIISEQSTVNALFRAETLADEITVAYDRLTEEEKAKVTNYSSFTSYRTVLSRLMEEKGISNLSKEAKAVVKLIYAIGKVEKTEASFAKITAARTAYDALTDAQKAEIDSTIYEILILAEQTKYALEQGTGETGETIESRETTETQESSAETTETTESTETTETQESTVETTETAETTGTTETVESTEPDVTTGTTETENSNQEQSGSSEESVQNTTARQDSVDRLMNLLFGESVIVEAAGVSSMNQYYTIQMVEKRIGVSSVSDGKTDETGESTTDESTTNESTTTESTTNESTVTESTTVESTTNESTTTESTTTESTTTESTTNESTVTESTTNESTTTESTSGENTTTQTSTTEHIASKVFASQRPVEMERTVLSEEGIPKTGTIEESRETTESTQNAGTNETAESTQVPGTEETTESTGTEESSTVETNIEETDQVSESTSGDLSTPNLDDPNAVSLTSEQVNAITLATSTGEYSPEIQKLAELFANNENYAEYSQNYVVAGAYYYPSEGRWVDGTGNFTFTKNSSGKDYVIAQDGSKFCSLENKELFRINVFDLGEEDFTDFGVTVTTMTAAQFGSLSAAQLANYGLVYITFGTEGYGTNPVTSVNHGNMLSEAELAKVFQTLISQEIPTIVDGRMVFAVAADGTYKPIADAGHSNTYMYQLAVLLLQAEPQIYLREDGTADVMQLRNLDYSQLAGKILKNEYDKNGNGSFVNKFVLSYLEYYSDFTWPTIVNSFFAKKGICTSSTGNTGFEAVLKEIETENMYRAADKGAGYPQLDTGVSIARAVRYIINYTYKRAEVVKTSLRVLEIQPGNASTASDTDELTKQIVSQWVGKQITTDRIVIDTMTSTEFVGRIDDINSIYDLIYIGSDCSAFETASFVDTSSNLNQANGSSTGPLIVFMYNWNTGSWDQRQVTNTEYIPEQYRCYYNNWSGTKPCYAYAGWGGYVLLAQSSSGGKMTPIYEWGNKKRLVGYALDGSGVSTATLYNGRLKDTAVPGGCGFQYAKSYTGPSYNDSSMNGMIYTNIGDVKYVAPEATGMLQTEWTGGDFEVGDRKSAWYRYAGNDLTAEKYNALMDYVDASYPIVISDVFYSTDESGNRIVNEKAVDNSSYMYDFMQSTLGFSNVVSTEDIKEGASSLFAFYINKPKMSIEITDYHDNHAATGGDNSNGVVHYLDSVLGKFYLAYTFQITNDGSVSNDMLYTARLFLDSNADGKFSEAYEELEGVSIFQIGSDGSEVEIPYNQLKANQKYLMKRELPANYDGVITWSLQVEQNSTSMIRASEQGYTKLNTGTKATIRILQIMQNDNNGLNLQKSVGLQTDSINQVKSSGSNTYRIYHTLVYGDQGETITDVNGNVIEVDDDGISDSYILDIRAIDCRTYMAEYANSFNADGTNDYLESYDMLILGFSDMYSDIWGDALMGLLNFIEEGKSVLFAHDTTSFREYNDGWAYNLNRYIRNYVGMDTYGVTLSRTGLVDNPQDYAVLNSGRAITPNDTIWNILYPKKENGRYLYNNKTIGFKPGSARTAAVSEVQGRSYGCMTRYRGSTNGETVNGVKYTSSKYYRKGITEGGNPTTTVVNNINKGQITAYPYYLPDQLTVPNTHAQYFSLDMNADDDDDGETDVVVWYCMNGGSKGYYESSRNDVMNNYYIYNKGNVTYTGVGHAYDATTIDEAKLFINTMVAAYNAGTKDIGVSILDNDLKKTEVLYEYDDAENEISFSDDLQKVYFTMNDPNIVTGTKNIEARFYIYKTGNVATPESINSDGTTYTLADASIAVAGDGAITSTVQSYTELDTGVTIDSTQKGLYYLYVKDTNNNVAYVSVEDLFNTQSEASATYRCDSSGSNYGAWQGYVKCYNWGKKAWDIMILQDGNWWNQNAWLSTANRLHLYQYATVDKTELQVVEFTNMVVYNQDGTVANNKELESGKYYYVEVPIDSLKEAGIIAKADSKNKFYISGTPYYKSVNKLTKVEKIKYGNTIYSKVDFTTIGIFDLD